jgi:hypothetical protein
MDGGKTNNFTCDMVIAKYKEDLDWLKKYEDKEFRNIYLYNKNADDNNKTANDLKCVLAGRECIKIDLEKNQHFVMIESDDRKYIYTNQNVGINLQSPDSKLELKTNEK